MKCIYISEGSCDTEHYINGCWQFSFPRRNKLQFLTPVTKLICRTTTQIQKENTPKHLSLIGLTSLHI